MKKKKCSSCGDSHSLCAEFWHRNKNSKDGFSGNCKDCCLKQKLEYREKNKQKIKESDAEYYKNNFEKISKRTSEWAMENKGMVKDRDAKRRGKNIDELKDAYIKEALKKSGYSDDQITTDLIEKRRSYIISKRLKIPYGTDLNQETTGGVPSWIN